jgi:trimeric autotransporter adhesin
MITGTSKTTLSVARMALMAGVSAAALVAAGSAASAGDLITLPTNTQLPGINSIQASSANANGGAALAALPVPSGIDINPYILENLNGVSTALGTGLTSTGALKTQTWAAFAGGPSDITAPTGASAVATGTYAPGDYLVKGGVIVNNAGAGLACAAAADNCKWVLPTDLNPANSYQWVPSTYANEAKALGGTILPLAANPGNAFITGTYAAGDFIIRTDTGALVNSATCTALVACKFVTPDTLDNAAANQTAGFSQNNAVPGPISALGTQTTTWNGGVAYTNAANNQSTAIGPDGITSKGAIWVNSNGQAGQDFRATVINNGTILSISGAGLEGGLTAIEGGKAFIIGGPANSNVNGAANITTLTAANSALPVVGGATVNNGLRVNNGFLVSGPSQGLGAQTVSMGGNRVQDVAAPVLGTDAANKAYVDKGVKKGYEGTALALAISQPVFLPGQNFAMRAGWGGFESENAVGFSAAGVVMRDPFGHGSTVALDGGVGFGTNYNTVGGKVGVTIGFGGGYAPMK